MDLLPVTLKLAIIDGSTVSLASFRVTATINNNGGTLTLTDNTNLLSYTPSSTTWTANIDISGTDIIFQVTGDAVNNVDWKVSIDPFVTM